MIRTTSLVGFLGLVLLATPVGLAQAPAAPPPPTATPTPSAALKLGGYGEVFLSHNFNDPDNEITNNRAFDAREDRLALSNAVVDLSGYAGAFSARVALQWGLTPDTSYASEPGDQAWRHVQQAYGGYRVPVGSGLLLEGGIFLSPVGPEGFAVKDNWHWSRSDLFYGLPSYHAGVRATYALSPTVTAMAMLCNGWNDVVDNNGSKSVLGQLLVTGDRNLSAAVLYFGGSERPDGAPEGQPWRHMLDGWVKLDLSRALAFQAQANGGFEDNRFGTSSWFAVSASARYGLTPILYAAARGDVFWESNPDGATPIFWSGAGRVASATVTLDARPLPEHVAVMLDARRDWATGDIYDAGAGSARARTTVTLGLTAWF